MGCRTTAVNKTPLTKFMFNTVRLFIPLLVLMNSALAEDVQPWTNPKKQTKEPVTVTTIQIIFISMSVRL